MLTVGEEGRQPLAGHWAYLLLGDGIFTVTETVLVHGEHQRLAGLLHSESAFSLRGSHAPC